VLTRNDQPINKLLALALLGAAGLALLNPALSPFVIAGVGLAFAPSLARLARATPRAVKWTVAGIALAGIALAGVVAVVALLIAFPSLSGGGRRAYEVRVPTVYSGQARQHGETLVVDDALTIRSKGLWQAARDSGRVYVPGEGFARGVRFDALVDTVVTSLKAQGWKEDSLPSAEGYEFRRPRPRPLVLKASWVPARTTNSIPIEPPEIGRVAREEPRAVLVFDTTSSITVTAEPYTIGDTSPRGARRPRKGMERVTIPIPADDDHVEIELASPLLRNAVTTHLGGASLSSASGWVLALLLFMAGEKGQELIRRLLRRIRRKGTEHEQSHAS